MVPVGNKTPAGVAFLTKYHRALPLNAHMNPKVEKNPHLRVSYVVPHATVNQLHHHSNETGGELNARVRADQGGRNACI